MDEVEFQRIRAADERIFNNLEAGNAEGFLSEIFSSDDENNVCGTFPTYLAMRLMKGARGEITGYQQCPADDEGTSIVSIGGTVFK